MEIPRHQEMQVGEFLLSNGMISKEQLDEALSLQKDNKDRLLGEILVTLGIFSKEEMIMALEMYLMVTDVNFTHVDEWLDQEEVDMLIERMKEKDGTKEK